MLITNLKQESCVVYSKSLHVSYDHVLLELQINGPPRPQLAKDLLPVPTSPSLPLMTTRQCYLEGSMLNVDMVQPAMTAILWILSQWYIRPTIYMQVYNIHTTTIRNECKIVTMTVFDKMFTISIYKS